VPQGFPPDSGGTVFIGKIALSDEKLLQSAILPIFKQDPIL